MLIPILGVRTLRALVAFWAENGGLQFARNRAALLPVLITVLCSEIPQQHVIGGFIGGREANNHLGAADAPGLAVRPSDAQGFELFLMLDLYRRCVYFRAAVNECGQCLGLSAGETSLCDFICH